MTLSITVLGCSGTYAAAGGACSGYLVRSATTTLLVDAGPGTLANVQEHIAISDLDGVVVTHEHPDHWLEVPVLRNAMKYSLGLSGLPMWTTAGTLALAEQLTGLTPTFRPTVVADGDELEVGDLSVRFSRTHHPVETLAVRVAAGGAVLGYTADTSAAWPIAELGDDLDLVVAEATFLDDEESGKEVHMSAAQAGAQARAAGARRLVVTHLLPGSDPAAAVAEAADAYGAPVEAAAVHSTYSV